MWLWKWFLGYAFVFFFRLELRFWPEHKSTNPDHVRKEALMTIDKIPPCKEMHGCSESELLPWWKRLYQRYKQKTKPRLTVDPRYSGISFTHYDWSDTPYTVTYVATFWDGRWRVSFVDGAQATQYMSIRPNTGQLQAVEEEAQKRGRRHV